MELITEKPLWFIIFCIGLGIGYAWFFYNKESRFAEHPQWLQRTMAALRAIFISLLSFLLLSPLIKSIQREVEKPLIIIAQDNSQSILSTKDSAYYRNEYVQNLNSLQAALGKDYEVRQYSFGSKVNENVAFTFDEKQSNAQQLFDNINVQYSFRNLGAIIFASDGLYNAGSSPAYAPEQLKVPFYTIAMGDTMVYKDVLLSQVRYNRTAIVGNSFVMEAEIDARQCAGKNITLNVTDDSVKVFSKTISVPSNKYRLTVPVYVEAKRKGIHEYKFWIDAIDGEASYTNNERKAFVDIIESKQKVLLLANAPHPDISSLKNAIETSPNYELKIVNVKDAPSGFSEYEMVVLHDIPSSKFNAESLLTKLRTSGVSVLHIIGAQTDVGSFNKAQRLINISGSNAKTNNVQAHINPNFSLYSISDDERKYLATLPPLICPFGIYKAQGNNATLLTQRVGNVTTDQPLLLFGQMDEQKYAILCGEGLWKWRLKEFQEKGSQKITDDFILKIVQFLCVKDKKEPLKIKYKNNYAENEPIHMDAEMYNESGELINTSDIQLIITNNEGKNFSYTFSKTEKAYSLDAGYYTVGKYSFKATATAGEQKLFKTGQFTISPLQIENSETVANHQLLNLMASKSGGVMVYPSELNSLVSKIKARKEITSVSYQKKQLKDLINLKWVFFLLMALVSLEWFIRKRSGAY
ncbi:MAG: hypothetical protein IPO27_07715 [Bacteroidetes bacterium]|nr:hypothetical protein [Bacteroidota bacterium]